MKAKLNPKMTNTTKDKKIDQPRPTLHQVNIVKPSYLPSKKELQEDQRVNSDFDEVAKALVQLVQLNYVDSPSEA